MHIQRGWNSQLPLRNPFDVFDMLPSKARPQGRARDAARTKEKGEEDRWSEGDRRREGGRIRGEGVKVYRE